jgi:phosphoribosyl 1,2-cyclic phosphodiesterase
MSLFIASLNSGSNGNCYYIGNETEAVLVDVGISCAEVEKRMKRLHLSMDKVKAIFVSHEHSDHILGIPVIARRYQLPVYITAGTYRQSKFHLGLHLVHSFIADQPVIIGNLSVTAFTKWHDAVDPHSFIVRNGSITVGVFTDIGKPCEQVINYFRLCHAVFLETNYDEEKLANGRYPIYLKKRIQSDRGHLSNLQALELFLMHRSAFMSHVLLAHLSKENNAPEIAETLFRQHAGRIQIIHASREKETALYQIEPDSKPTDKIKRPKNKPERKQLSLF